MRDGFAGMKVEVDGAGDGEGERRGEGEREGGEGAWDCRVAEGEVDRDDEGMEKAVGE